MSQQKVKSLYILKQEAAEHLKNKEYTSAATYYQDILASFQKIIETIETEELMEKTIRQLKLPSHKNLTLCYLKLGRPRQCIQHSEQVLNLQPNNTKIIFRIGKAYTQIKQLSKAEQYLRRGYILDPNQKQFMRALENIQILKCQKTQLKVPSKTLIQQFFQILVLPLTLLLMIYQYLFARKGKINSKEN